MDLSVRVHNIFPAPQGGALCLRNDQIRTLNATLRNENETFIGETCNTHRCVTFTT